MPIRLTAGALRKAFPHAKPGAVEAFVSKQGVLDAFGVTETRNRLAIFLAQLDHESGGMTIIAENLNYSAERMTQVWPKRFPTVAAARPYAHNPKALANKTYGGRMGNRPGTDDGWDYRGRGFIQNTGRDDYREVGRVCGLPLENKPEMMGAIDLQPEVTTGFWSWKKINGAADSGDFVRVTKLINGGTIGLKDRQTRLARIRPIIDQLQGAPSTPRPPKAVIDEATKRDKRRVTAASVGTVASAGVGGVAAGAGPDSNAPDPVFAFVCAIVCIAIVAGSVILILKKQAAIAALWR